MDTSSTKMLTLIEHLIKLYKEDKETSNAEIVVQEPYNIIQSQNGEYGYIARVFGKRQTGTKISYWVEWEGTDYQHNPWPRTWNEEKACEEQSNWNDLLADFLGESDFVPETPSSSSEEDCYECRKRKRKLPPLGCPPHGGKRGPPPLRLPPA